MNIPDKLEKLFESEEDKYLTVREIRERVWDFDELNGLQRTNSTSIIPSDYCYNKTNKGAREIYLFHWENGKYRPLGVDNQYNGYIYHKPRSSTTTYIAGEWINGERIQFAIYLPSEQGKLYLHDEDEETSFVEGKKNFSLHLTRERDVRLSRIKKEQQLSEYGFLKCEVCDFDFHETYGERGFGYIECHHNKPISELDGEAETLLADLSLLCSNCHRMIHRIRPWISTSALKEITGSNS